MNGKFVYGVSFCDVEVFDLVFFDEEFFIFKKYGNICFFDCCYYIFMIEFFVKWLEWNEVMEYFFDKYCNFNGFLIIVVLLLVLIIVLVLLLSQVVFLF